MTRHRTSLPQALALALLTAVAAANGVVAAGLQESSKPLTNTAVTAEPYSGATAKPRDSDLRSTAETSALENITVTADFGVSRDDNIYLTDTDKNSDTIVSVTPGLAFRLGQNSLANFSIGYRQAFTRYENGSVPNVSLGAGSAAFGYETGSLTVAGAATFQQLNQNNREVASLGQKAIYRRDQLGINTSAESRFTAKTSGRIGANYNKSEYKTGGFTGSEEIGVPVKLYLAATPKVSMSVGAGYRRVKPQNGGETGRDMDYNIGARGEFTPKLSGELSVNYRTRQVGSYAAEDLWGFSGAFSYELTPKASASLDVSRDFSTGALGESLKNSSYAFKASAELTQQWQMGAGLVYRHLNYGPPVFSPTNAPTQTGRNDRYWEGNLQASYRFRSWLSATADYTLRNNDSTLPGAQFSNNILSLTVGWRY